MALLLVFCSFCLISGVDALALTEVGHSEMTHMHEGEEHNHVSAQESDADENVTCCDSGGEIKFIKIDDDHVYLPDTIPNGVYIAWQESDDFSFDYLKHHVEPHSPPDDNKRQESERDSTRLRL